MTQAHTIFTLGYVAVAGIFWELIK